jgi:hypothetical protein
MMSLLEFLLVVAAGVSLAAGILWLIRKGYL